MGTNPLVDQGTLNRIRGNVVVTNSSELNITAPYLGRDGISLSLEGDSTAIIGTMTGAATSPEAYMMATITAQLLKTQTLSDTYKRRMETNTRIGPITVRPDSAALSPYEFQNCAIQTVASMKLNGEDVGFIVTIKGQYLINSSMFDLN